MRPILVLTALALSLFIAGCNAPAPTTPPPPADVIAPYLVDNFPVDVEHDHADPALHDANHNIRFVAHHACTPDGTVASAIGGYTDIAFFGTYAFVGHSQGFCVLDISQPAAPRYVATYNGEQASDLEVSTDGRVVYLTTQRNQATGPVTEGDTNVQEDLPRGVIVVDVSDPAMPTYLSYYPVPTNGVHTATPYRHGDRELLFIQTYDWFPPQGITPEEAGNLIPTQNLPGTQRVEVTELKPVNGVPTLQRLSMWSLDRPAEQPFAHYFPHDAAAQYHPLAKKNLLYVAYWNAGLVILDVDDPANPKLLSQYDDLAPGAYNNYHDVKVFDQLVDGRHITITGPELPSATEAGLVRVFDTTDPAQPKQVGVWRLPENPGHTGGFLYSPHVFTLDLEGRIYIGHNHGGVWVIDVHNQTLQEHPVSMGYFFPRGNETSQEWSRHQHTWGAYVRDGHIYATEGSGVHVLRYAGA